LEATSARFVSKTISRLIATHTLVTESHNSQESRPLHEQYQANFLKIAPARLTSATHKNIMPVLASKTKQAFPALEREA
jgi:hypothetical protein